MTKQAVKKIRTQFLSAQEDQPSDLITFRRPRQKRGVKKFEAILDAAHELIISKGVNNFSLYDIADHADVAVGSVYHFFPGIEAVFAALVERYDLRFWEIVSEHIPPETVENWGDIIWHHIEKSRQYINEQEQVLIMILGPGQTWQTRQVDTAGDTAIARAMWNNINQYFDVPASPDPAELLHLAIRILESFWQLSYQRHEKVTKEMQQETYRAICSYLELYWPKYLQRKDPVLLD
jgi:AcrR family transcriptional regulator